MYISRVVIQNYRNLAKVDVSLREGLTCLVGENNSGKSNFLRAVSLACDANFPNYHRTLASSDFSHGLNISAPQQVMVALQFADFDSAGNPAKVKEHALVQDWTLDANTAQIAYRFRPNELVRQAIESKQRPPANLTIEDYGWELAAGAVLDDVGKPKNLADVAWNDDFVSSVRLNRLPAYRVVCLQALRDVESDLQRRTTSPLQKLLEVRAIPEAKKNALLKLLADANAAIANDADIMAIAEDIDTAFEEAVGPIFSLAVTVGIGEVDFASLARSLTLLLTGAGMTDADPSKNGLGLNNALYIAMILKYFDKRRQAADTAGQLLLLEEPEAHLHPQLQRILFRRLMEKGCQVISTSHSTHISSQAALDGLVVLTRENATSSFCRPDTLPQLVTAERDDLARYLDATRSLLLFAKRVLLVEGMSEVFVIPPLVKRLLNVDLEEQGIAVVPIHGTHFSSYVKLFGATAIRKKCAVLTDGDITPDDAPDATGDGAARLAALRALENDFVRVFHCTATFEIALAAHHNLGWLSTVILGLGAPQVGKELTALAAKKTLSGGEAEAAAGKVLASARRFGKARFAQLASEDVALASIVPPYISDAIAWLRQ